MARCNILNVSLYCDDYSSSRYEPAAHLTKSANQENSQLQNTSCYEGDVDTEGYVDVTNEHDTVSFGEDEYQYADVHIGKVNVALKGAGSAGFEYTQCVAYGKTVQH